MRSKANQQIQDNVDEKELLNVQFIIMNKSNSKNSNKDVKKSPGSDFSESASASNQAFATQLQEIKSQLFEDSKQYINDPIKRLHVMQQSIDEKMRRLDELNGEFYEKQQKMFLKTFLNMMDRMSNQLLEANRLYDNIDQQIDSQPECVKLRQKLIFYKNECLFLTSQLQNSEEQLATLKSNNTQKQYQNFQLSSKLMSEIKKQKKYKQRKYSLETKLEGFDCFKTLKNHSKEKESSKRKSISSYHYEDMDKSLQEVKFYVRDGIIKRPMTSINTYRLQQNDKIKGRGTRVSSKTHRDVGLNQPIDKNIIYIDHGSKDSRKARLSFKRNKY